MREKRCPGSDSRDGECSEGSLAQEQLDNGIWAAENG